MSVSSPLSTSAETTCRYSAKRRRLNNHALRLFWVLVDQDYFQVTIGLLHSYGIDNGHTGDCLGSEVPGCIVAWGLTPYPPQFTTGKSGIAVQNLHLGIPIQDGTKLPEAARMEQAVGAGHPHPLLEPNDHVQQQGTVDCTRCIAHLR